MFLTAFSANRRTSWRQGRRVSSRALRTDPRQLDGQQFDVLVIGGGVQGAAFAREAALRGARTLLVERDDFGCGTSSRSSRLVHGGVRYLQQGHFALVREALAERERLLRLAPHLVRPLPMLMPFFTETPGSRWVARFGLWLYGKLARHSTLPPAQAHGAADCLRLFPGLRRQGLRGGVHFWDAATDDLRLVLAVLAAAHESGASLCNHTEVVGVRGGSLRLLDHASGVQVAVRARHVLNAAGPGVDPVRRVLGIEGPPLIRTSRGSHVVLAPRAAETALAAFLPDRRIQFVVPHRDGTICGTTEVDEPYEPQGATVPEADVDYLLQALGLLLETPPARGDVRFAYAGWRSLPMGRGPAGALNREAFVVTERSPVGDVATAVGGKLTTHRSFAERVVNRLLGVHEPSPSRDAPLPGGDGPREPLDPLWQRHGSRATELRRLAQDEPAWRGPLCPHRGFVVVEAIWGLRRLGAVTFSDLMLRRLSSTAGPCLREECLRAAHGWFVAERGSGPPFETARDGLRAEVRRLAGAGVADV
jgi:glycerol-3-phosphate dehydrogenase